MSSFVTARGVPHTTARAAALSAVLLACAFAPAGATEVLGDLTLHVRVVEIAVDPGTEQGLARLHVTLESFSPVEDVAVGFRRSEGVPWTPASVPVETGAVVWSRRGSSEPVAPGGRLHLLRRDALTAEIVVPLDHAGLYEIVAEAAGRVGDRNVRAEALALVPLGVELPRPVAFEGAVEYRAVPGSGVQP